MGETAYLAISNATSYNGSSHRVPDETNEQDVEGRGSSIANPAGEVSRSERSSMVCIHSSIRHCPRLHHSTVSVVIIILREQLQHPSSLVKHATSFLNTLWKCLSNAVGATNDVGEVADNAGQLGLVFDVRLREYLAGPA
ncbi:hypothetical protein DOTSEDRAFT_72715 [Dothistroma septosporum NZE10]|uniref:Uncharacterized protein n=1 Tax=Dothistroma septosporum (strain NZE10 / CBS 128990) TaxID=675120 RepID=M2XLV2_DOTSN|nr:hypothetical protein DOTSEDRAFT_72715 [Dothistroma septosporum NZE10]